MSSPLVEVIAKQYYELIKEYLVKNFKASENTGPLNGVLITDPGCNHTSIIILVGFDNGEISYENVTKTSLVDNDKLLNTFSTNTMVNHDHIQNVKISILYNLVPKGME